MSIPLLFGFLFSNPKVLLIVAAVIPALVLMIYVYRSDRVEKEPTGLLLGLLFWGVISTFLAMISETAGSWLLAN